MFMTLKVQFTELEPGLSEGTEYHYATLIVWVEEPEIIQ